MKERAISTCDHLAFVVLLLVMSSELTWTRQTNTDDWTWRHLRLTHSVEEEEGERERRHGIVIGAPCQHTDDDHLLLFVCFRFYISTLWNREKSISAKLKCVLEDNQGEEGGGRFANMYLFSRSNLSL